MVGERVQQVLYFTIDYRREEVHPEKVDTGPRLIEDQSEWKEPTWLHDGFDALDYGLEIMTDSGASFSLTWDPPGDTEGIGLHKVPMLGSGVMRKADVAIWNVGQRNACWAFLIGRPVTGVDLHYVPWANADSSLGAPASRFAVSTARSKSSWRTRMPTVWFRQQTTSRYFTRGLRFQGGAG